MSFRPALFLILINISLQAQTKPEPDTLIFTNGDKLVGQLERSTGSSVTFKSDMVGEITVDWSKIREIHSDRSFAVIPKNVTFKRHADTSAIPEGKLSLADQKLTVTPPTGAPQTVPVTEASRVVNDTDFKNAVDRQPGFFTDWKGTLTGAAALVEATQHSETFSGAVSLARLEPSEDWLTRQNRTSFDFSATYGTISQPATPEIKTDIFHVGLERDEYFSSAFYGFAQGLLDHNFSQNLSLQQTYGGGIGWSVIKKANQSLDLKGGLTYIHQKFSIEGDDQSLIAALVEEDYKRTLVHGMVFTQALILNPTLNNTNAFTGTASALLTLPLYKRINSSLGITDGYLHDPPAGFKKNSFQFTAGLTYSIK
jgi:hypothetical protein